MPLDLYQGIPVVDVDPVAEGRVTPLNDTFFPKLYGRGFDVQQMLADPKEMFAQPGEMPAVPQSDWEAFYKQQEDTESSLKHIRMRSGPNGGHIPSLDQNGQGYCWAYSTTATVMFARAAAGKPYARLSAHAIGCLVKSYRDEGGWCGLSAKKIREMGVPTTKTWPEKSMSRSNDTDAMRAEAAGNRIISDWVDLTKAVYDQNLTRGQLASALFQNNPCAVDFDWWGHSVTALQWVLIEAGSWGLLILNSWTDGWGEKGMQVLRGNKMVPMGAISTRGTLAA
jgi:hypothetical protein